jgi:hypothetical protein
MRILVPAIGLLLAGQAFAHPDHSFDSGIGLGHVVTDPFHLCLLAAATAVAYGARYGLRHRMQRRAASASLAR